MRKNCRIIILSLFIIISAINGFCAIPDEGMWLPLFISRLNYSDMQKEGLHLTADELYSINHSSLKDAVVMLDGGQCSSEIISAEGLLLTNHHCGYDAIQAHSSIDHDYLTNGFWAYKKKDELKNEGMTATFLIRIEDVTQKVLKDIKAEATESDRLDVIKTEGGKIEKEAEAEGKYEAVVKSFFEGNEYYLFVYETFKDIRLVGAPPSSIGKFGGDTDNWMWPRQTGDFSIFRIYTSPEGKPANYAEENLPLKSKHYLPISLKAKKNKDFAMIWGYPGNTQRYLTSEGVKVLLEQTAPAIIKLRGKKLELMKEDMDADPKVRIQYAAKYSETSNYWKYYIGQEKGLNKLKVFDKKKAEENEFKSRTIKEPKLMDKYGKVIDDFDNAYKQINEGQFDKRLWYYQETFMGAEAVLLCLKLQNKGITYVIDDFKKNTSNPILDDIKNAGKDFYKDYNKPTDRKIFAGLMEMFSKNIPKNYQPDIFDNIGKKFHNNFQSYADYVYTKSVFSDEASFNKFLQKPKSKKYKKDPMVKVMTSLLRGYLDLTAQESEINRKLKKTKRLYLEGLREMNPEKKYYSDANSTMRMTYGIIDDYYPSDAVHYDYETTLRGVMEKEDSLNEEFIVPKKLKELFKNRDYGKYGEDGKLITCFIANTDITGGNSGSPVMNGDGELIGIAFDGNWEAMSGDIAYEPGLQRTICVDIRYVLFIIDKFAGATNLIKEIEIR